MILNVHPGAIAQAVYAAAEVAPVGSARVGLAGMLLSVANGKASVQATNLDVWSSFDNIDIEEGSSDGSVVVEAAKVAAIVKHAQGEISFRVNDKGNVEMRTATGRFTLPTWPVESWPGRPDDRSLLVSVSMPAAVLGACLNRVGPFSRDLSRAANTDCIQVIPHKETASLTLVATDGVVGAITKTAVAEIKWARETDTRWQLIPKKTARMISTLCSEHQESECSLVFTNNRGIFKVADALIDFSIPASNAFPPYDQAVSSFLASNPSPQARARVDCLEMARAVSQAANFQDESTNSITLSIKGETLTVKCFGAGSGEVAVRCSSSEGGIDQVVVGSEYMTGIFRSLKGEAEVHAFGTMKNLFVFQDATTFVLAPRDPKVIETASS